MSVETCRDVSQSLCVVQTHRSNAHHCSINCGRRTLKYLLGVLCGKWVVAASWLSASLAAGSFVPEADHEVRMSHAPGTSCGIDAASASSTL